MSPDLNKNKVAFQEARRRLGNLMSIILPFGKTLPHFSRQKLEKFFWETFLANNNPVSTAQKTLKYALEMKKDGALLQDINPLPEAVTEHSRWIILSKPIRKPEASYDSNPDELIANVIKTLIEHGNIASAAELNDQECNHIVQTFKSLQEKHPTFSQFHLYIWTAFAMKDLLHQRKRKLQIGVESKIAGSHLRATLPPPVAARTVFFTWPLLAIPVQSSDPDLRTETAPWIPRFS